MNDFDPSLDEIVSAYVDGAATPAERARVEADPALLERAATFRNIHGAIAAPDTPADDELRQALISRALAQTVVSGATVHSLRGRRSATLGPIVAAAAVIAMFFGLGTLLVASQDRDSSGDAASTAADADSFNPAGPLNSPAAGATSGGKGGAGQGQALQEAAPPTDGAKVNAGYLGGFADETALRQAVISARDETASSTATTTPSRAAAATTDSAAQCGRSDPADAKIYAADLRGRPVTVVVSGTRADVFDNVTCQRSTIELPTR